MLVPKDWTFAGGVAWDFAKIPPDAKIAYTVSSPDGDSVFEKTAPTTFMWSQFQKGGQVYFLRKIA